jgi:hypothetical protein
MDSVNNTKSVILKISLLETEYNNTLIQYQQAYQNYTEDLTKYQTNKTFNNILNGRVFWGTSGIKQISTNDINVCKASCSETPNCSGATFNSTSNTCWLRSGDGDVFPGLNTENAIIPDVIQSSNILKKLNAKLLDINTKIINLIQSSTEDYTTQIQTRNNLDTQLKQNYNDLIKETNHVNRLIRETENMDELNNNSQIIINHYYLIYKVIIILVFLCILIVVYNYMKK